MAPEIYNSRNYWSLLAQNGECDQYDHLQQQKLLELTSPNASTTDRQRSTIVEIIGAYQPAKTEHQEQQYLQQQKLLELTSLTKQSGKLTNLQQQKLLELTSPEKKSQGQNQDLQQQKLLELTSLKSSVRLQILYLQQQKLLELTSLNKTIIFQNAILSTIVEIIGAYQPKKVSHSYVQIYNSRNYWSLLAKFTGDLVRYSSTIVEIIGAYQPEDNGDYAKDNLQQQKLLELTSRPASIASARSYLQQQKLLELTSHIDEEGNIRPHLQQQKLLELTSPPYLSVIIYWIYNSRNYWSLLAAYILEMIKATGSTIVEIIGAYQPVIQLQGNTSTSTIVEIIGAYQPFPNENAAPINLQQQKLLELTSPYIFKSTGILIYNSRNYWSLLAIKIKNTGIFISTIVEIIGAYQPMLNSPNFQQSTIVEIIGAYQPSNLKPGRWFIYNSRNYWSLLALCCSTYSYPKIYNSRNYWSLLARRPCRARAIHIYNSRNYWSLLARNGI